MNRPKKTARDKAFYIPVQDHPGVGVMDSYGSVFITKKDGSIRCIERKKACTQNKR